ncbi:hypothetical protein AXX17_AT3G36890 [Arabidopsis thaliana]|uniref:Uncharacterized protein n=1 Tax=Arabidopsis thaliana TaxID=3702 RepID=A0A178VDU2_ARATH|nr:hypothetical protein AXX17_AT3G36890 [Arabidopsis thaliana]
MSNPQSSYSVRNVLEKDKLNRSNPPEHLEDLEKKKTFKISSSGIYVIEVNVTTSGSTPWVLDTGCGAHICVNVHGLNNSRTLEEGQVDLRVANGAKVSALAVGTYSLSLPSCMVLELKNCYYVPAINKNIISVSCLDMEGYPKETKGYYFYHPTDNKVFVARNGAFLEREFLSKGTSGSKVLLEEVRESQGDVPTSREEHTLDLRRVIKPIHVEPEVRRSERSRHKPDRFGDWVMDDHALFIIESDEPTSYEEAMMGPDSDKWLEAAKFEMESMSQNKVWTLVDLPDGVKAIKCKWIFMKKIDMDGNIQIYKARLVAKGFKQIHGIDYDETYSPVAMLKSFRILLATAAHYDYEIWQMDLKTAFLNGNLE